jgi:Holliday junction resolvasome RuvABC DNA-binding subunit
MNLLPDLDFSDDTKNISIVSDAIMAMVSLGYTKSEAEKAVGLASNKIDVSAGVEILIKEALSYV